MTEVSAHDVVYDGWGSGWDWWTWWLEHGFDGLAAGVIGGAVAGYVLRRTIRNERELRQVQERADALRSLERDCLTFYATAMELELEAARRRTGRDMEWLATLYKEALLLEARARLVDTGFADEIFKLAELATDINPDDSDYNTRASTWATGLSVLARKWTLQPESRQTAHVADVLRKVNRTQPSASETSAQSTSPSTDATD